MKHLFLQYSMILHTEKISRSQFGEQADAKLILKGNDIIRIHTHVTECAEREKGCVALPHSVSADACQVRISCARRFPGSRCCTFFSIAGIVFLVSAVCVLRVHNTIARHLQVSVGLLYQEQPDFMQYGINDTSAAATACYGGGEQL
jgi:hypothetical protein